MQKLMLGAVATLAATMLAAGVSAYEGGAVADGGSISGTVKYQGDPPAPAKIAVTKDNDVCGKEKTSPDLIVGADKGIANVVVRISNITKGKALTVPTTNPVFDQKGCEYAPHVLAFPAGSTVSIQNSDGILHNVHTTSTANPSFNQAQPKFKKVIEAKIEKPEMPIKVQCDAHGWMHAWWISEDNPYYAVTDDKGAFKIADVPPGDYELEFWQETLGKQTQKVSVKAKEDSKVDVTMTKK
ncbi:MAG TPA: carboxypeptidase regulatory-like domain-containing protein [Candidatus Binatia bacterium]|jgi:plastocyanin